MSKLYIPLMLTAMFVTHNFAMEVVKESVMPKVIVRSLGGKIISTPFSEDIGHTIVFAGVRNVDRYVDTPEEAAIFLVTIDRVNKACHGYVNNPAIMRNIICNFALGESLTKVTGYEKFKKGIAEKINTPAAQNYILLSEKLYCHGIDPRMIETLVEFGADVNYAHDRQFTTFCLNHAPVASLQKALELGAHAHSCGYDVLHNALSQENIEAIKVILPFHPAVHPFLHIEVIVRKNNLNIIDLVFQHSVNPTDYFLEAVRQDNFELMQRFLNDKADPNAVFTRSGNSALFHVIVQMLKNMAQIGAGTMPYSVETVRLLCDHLAYDARALKGLYGVKTQVEELIAILEKNKLHSG